ncbi:MAG TPA: hypothetical protein PLN48_11765 [Lachnospiraceae bacterium]|nr:hypothetical protein [Lachnospiraceae bacterium]
MTPNIDDIDKYLTEVKAAVAINNYRISLNEHRPDNRELFADYIIDEAKAKEILISLNAEDFSEVRNNDHKGFEHELLYIFGKDVRLLERFGSAEEKTFSLYIKFNKLDNSFIIVVSFHEQEWPMRYAFK